MGFELEEGDESLILPWRWHILFMPLEAGRGISTENTCGWTMCFLLKTLVLVRKIDLFVFAYYIS